MLEELFGKPGETIGFLKDAYELKMRFGFVTIERDTSFGLAKIVVVGTCIVIVELIFPNGPFGIVGVAVL